MPQSTAARAGTARALIVLTVVAFALGAAIGFTSPLNCAYTRVKLFAHRIGHFGQRWLSVKYPRVVSHAQRVPLGGNAPVTLGILLP